MNPIDGQYQSILAVVNRQRRRKFLLQLFRGVLFASALFLFGWVLFALVDIPLQLDPPVRLVLMLILLAATLFAIAFQILRPLYQYVRGRGPFSV